MEREAMSIRRVLRIDDEADKKILTTKCKPVKLPDRTLKQLIADMFETMHAANGVGLAAPQVGLPIQLCVIEIPPETKELEDGTEVEVSPAEQYVFINPRITKMSDERLNRHEGCLSLPGWYADVPRAAWVSVEYQELNGKVRRIRKADGLLGHAIQHEVDHLNGILFTDRIVDMSTLKEVTDDSEEPVAA
jgi:peptide deformylase